MAAPAMRPPAPVPTAPVPSKPAAPAAEAAPRAPDLTVITVTHNGCDRALETLESARASLGDVTPQWVVVDSGSTDGTPEAVEDRWDDVRVIRRSNIGFAAGNNVGLESAYGRYVLLLNPDVSVVRGTLADLIAALDERPHVGAASVIQQAPDGRLQYSIRRFPSARRKLAEALFSFHVPLLQRLGEAETRAPVYRSERSADWLVGAFLMVRREAIEDAGPLDERFFLYSEEIDWCRRIQAAGWEIRHMPHMVVTHYLGGRPSPPLRGQLTYSKILYAEKHLRLHQAAAFRAGLVVQHGLRLALALPVALVSRGWRTRVRGEALCLALSLGVFRDPHATLQRQLKGP